MEGSESEAIFTSLNLNPQLFINEALNCVDVAFDEARDAFHEIASTALNIRGTDRSDDLAKGIDNIWNRIRAVLYPRLNAWEEYCLKQLFSVPEGFSLHKAVEQTTVVAPKASFRHVFWRHLIEFTDPIDGMLVDYKVLDESPCEQLMGQDSLNDTELDGQLNSLRDKITLVGKETAELNKELQELEMQTTLSSQGAGSVDEVLQLHEQESVHELFQELTKAASELRMKVEELKVKRAEDINLQRTERMYVMDDELFRMNHGNGLFNATQEKLEEFMADIKPS